MTVIHRCDCIIHTPDTDVFLISLGVSFQITAELFIRAGTQNKARIISLSKVKVALQTKYELCDMQLVSMALLGIHSFTGCDTISSFSGKGKVKPLQLMLKNQSCIEFFASFGEKSELSDDHFEIVQKFVCELYGHKEENTNIVRYKLYAAKQGKLDPKSLPPCSDSLKLHTERALYQAFIWRNCLKSHPDIPSPVGHGWEVDDNGDYAITWNSVNPAPDEVLSLLFCTCSRQCVEGSCQCIDNSLYCTDACIKQNCDNMFSEQDEEDFCCDDDEDDEDDYDYDD